MAQSDFEREVLTALAELRPNMKAVRDHLARLNGTVARHEDRLQEQDKRITEQAARSTADAAAEARWEKRLHPVIMLVVGLAIGLLLMHGPEVMKALK